MTKVDDRLLETLLVFLPSIWSAGLYYDSKGVLRHKERK